MTCLTEDSFARRPLKGLVHYRGLLITHTKRPCSGGRQDVVGAGRETIKEETGSATGPGNDPESLLVETGALPGSGQREVGWLI
jgi:hypothetical protein